MQFSVQLASQSTALYEVGPDGEKVYGWIRLAGPTDFDGEPAEVELLADIEYINGDGDWFGYFTLSFEDDSTLAVRAPASKTEAATDTSDASFTGPLRVIGGSGRFLDASGDGELEGSRAAVVGSDVDMTLTLNLETE